MGPEKKIRAGAIQANVWRNKVPGKDAEYLTVTLDRSYKDKEGNWKKTNSFRTTDIPKAVLCMNKAFEYISLEAEKPATDNNDNNGKGYEEITV